MNRTTLAPSLLAVLLLAACSSGTRSTGSGSVTTTGAPGAQTATVEMNDRLAFAPATVRARVGTVTLTVRNVGRVPHNLHFDDAGLGRTGTVDGGAQEPLKVVFGTAGTYTFVCTFHSGMAGKVVVS